ncbi:nucleobindin-2-like isoform X2 [Mizuhopecten yessoensis]|uniref:nucleobindin-2-like isoform X2 n=1 Tax=Mizuhopecten yessoensis TaxID=6573 RepID=UPI000B45DF7C|nr:nucleobindin-2-like isoform X2 [Mizuhopecten yessoensis]
MRTLLVVVLGLSLYSGIICPPVQTQPEEGGSDTDDEDTGLEYDRYLKEIIMALEEDPSFRKKLEEANVTDIKSGKIASHLNMVAHNIRERLDEIKRREISRLKTLAREKMKTMHGIQKMDGGSHHVDTDNHHSFEVSDLEKLILKATQDLEAIDKKRREEFKTYEMAKEHERQDHLKNMSEEERKKEEEQYEELQKKHKDHPKMHHPGSKKQLEEVWQNTDHLDPDSFEPKTFFKFHDIDGNGFLDEDEVEALFQKELDRVYDENAPEDDMTERYEEMARMREHVVTEIDADKDKLVSLEEFLKYTHGDDFKKDEGWESLDEQDPYTDEEYQEYERMLREEEEMRRRQGTFDNHAQPGVVMHPPQHANVQEMEMPQQVPQHQQQQFMQQQQQMQGMPQQGMPQHMQGMPQQGMPQQHMQGIPQQGMPQQHMQGMPQQHGIMPQQQQQHMQGVPQQQQQHMQGMPQQHQQQPVQGLPQQHQQQPVQGLPQRAAAHMDASQQAQQGMPADMSKAINDLQNQASNMMNQAQQQANQAQRQKALEDQAKQAQETAGGQPLVAGGGQAPVQANQAEQQAQAGQQAQQPIQAQQPDQAKPIH